MKYDLVVIGGVAAGTSAAAAAKRADKNLSIWIFQKEPYISYGGCGLPYTISGKVKSPESVIGFSPEEFSEKKGADVYTGFEAESIDFKNKTVKFLNGKEVHYGKLMIATGASPVIPDFSAKDEKGFFKLRNPDDATEIINYIESEKVKNAVIIGAGYIGLETAENLSEKNINLTVIEAGNNVFGCSDGIINKILKDYIKNDGVNLLTETFVKNVYKKDSKFSVQTDKESIETDMVIVAVGVKPNTDFIKDENLKKLNNGAIIVNDFSETSVSDVYSGGDCATVKNIITGKNVYYPLGTNANKQGKTAGRNIAGIKEAFPGILGSMITKYKNTEYGKTGLDIVQAQAEGFDAAEVYIKAGSKAGYYSGNAEIHMKLIFEKSGRIIGAVYCGQNILQRLNAVTALIKMNGTVYDLENMDFAYAPPFSPVWDINLLAAANAVKMIKKI